MRLAHPDNLGDLSSSWNKGKTSSAAGGSPSASAMLARLRPGAKLSLAGLGRLSVSKHSLWFDLKLSTR
jgi:hypothetical protein